MEIAISDQVFSALEEARQLFMTPIGHALYLDAERPPRNIIGIGIREWTVHGYGTGEACVAVYATDPAQLEIPGKIQGVPTQVIHRDPFVGFAGFGERDRHRPALIGVSLGHEAGPIGTLGFVGHYNGAPCIVGCNHVLARENEAHAGDVILQPAPGEDGGGDGDQVAELTAWEDLDFEGGSNLVDAAVAVFEEPDISSWIYDLGPLTSERLSPRLNLKVQKSGRSTGTRYGRVTDLHLETRYELRRGEVAVIDHLEITGRPGEPFSWLGDSGALVVEPETRQPVGIVVGGNGQATIVARLSYVFEFLGVSF